MEIREFKERTLALLTEPETADLPDEVWWDRFGEVLNDILAARAGKRRAEREANRCVARYQGVAQCVRSKHYTSDHFNPATGRWKNEVTAR